MSVHVLEFYTKILGDEFAGEDRDVPLGLAAIAKTRFDRRDLSRRGRQPRGGQASPSVSSDTMSGF